MREGSEASVFEAVRRKASGLMVVAGLTGSLAIAACSTPEQVPSATTQPPAVTIETTPDTSIVPTPTNSEKQCPSPTEADLTAVDQLLAEPIDSLLNVDETADGPKQAGGGNKGGSTEKDSTAEDYAQKRADTYRQIGAKYGVTVYDSEPVFDRMFQDPNLYKQGQYPAPFNTYLALTQDYLRQYGINVQVGPISKTYSYGGRTPSAAELETRNAKQTVLNFMQAFTTLPAEIQQLTNIKNIYLVTGTDSQNVAAYAENSQDPHLSDTIVVSFNPDNQNTPLDPMGLDHEAGHMIDNQICLSYDGMKNDPGFNDLNGTLRVYKSDADKVLGPPNPHTYLETYQQAEINRNRNLRPDQMTPQQLVNHCEDEQVADAAMAKTLTLYNSDSSANIVEDKAEVYATILDQNNLFLSDKGFGILGEKVRYQLAQLYDRSPNIAKYLIDAFKPRQYQQDCSQYLEPEQGSGTMK